MIANLGCKMGIQMILLRGSGVSRSVSLGSIEGISLLYHRDLDGFWLRGSRKVTAEGVSHERERALRTIESRNKSGISCYYDVLS